MLRTYRYILFDLIGIFLFFVTVDAHSANVHITTEVKVGYDDNITFRHSQEERSLFSDTTLGLEVNDSSSVHELIFDIGITQRIFSNTPDFNNISESCIFSYSREFFDKDRFVLSDTFIHADEPRSFSDFFGRSPERYSFFLNEFNISYDNSIYKRLSLYTGYSVGTYNADSSSVNDSIIHIFEIGPTLSIGEKKDIFLHYRFGLIDFSGGAGDSKIHSAILGVSSYLTRSFSINLKIGADYIVDFVGDRYVKPTCSVSFIHFVDKTTQTAITFSKAFSSTYYTNDIFDEWKVTVYAGRQIDRHTKVFISGFYGNGRYVSFGIEDNLAGAGIGLEYEVTDNWLGRFSYEYSLNHSNKIDREYQRNCISIGLSRRF